jgi:hypothetical protein
MENSDEDHDPYGVDRVEPRQSYAFAQGSAGATPCENGDAAFRTYHSAAGQ